MTTQHKKELLVLICILVFALGLRLTLAVLTTSWRFSSKDNFWQYGYEMGQIAHSLASGGGFSWPKEGLYYYPGQPTAWMPPVYPAIIAAAFKGLGIYSQQAALALELFQILVSVLSCILLFVLGKRLYNTQVGMISAFLFAIYPPAIHFAVQKIWPSSLFTLCVLLVIYTFLYLADYPRVKIGICLGILLAFTVLVDPVIIGVYPFAFVWLYLRAKGSRHIVIWMLTIAMPVFCLSIAPWMVRNYLAFGQLVFIKSNFGNELYIGNREGATGSYKDYQEVNWSQFAVVGQKNLRQAGEIAQSRFLLHKAVAYIVEDPLGFIQRTVKRCLRYWTDIKPIKNREEMIAQVVYLIVLALALVGLMLSNIRRGELQLVLLFLLFLPLPYYLTHISFYRYRLSTDVILTIFSGYAIYQVSSRLRKTLVSPL